MLAEMLYWLGRGGLRVVRVAAKESPVAWRDALEGFEFSKAQVLKRDGATQVLRAMVLGRDTVIKAWSLVTSGDKVKALFGGSRAERHWMGAERLVAAGVPTAKPWAMVVDNRGDFPTVLLAIPWIEGPTVLEMMARRESVISLYEMGDAVGRGMAGLTRAGLYNRDHKPSNLIAVRGHPPTAAVIDCVAIKKAKDTDGLARMFASLLIEPMGVGKPAPERFLAGVIDRLTNEGFDGRGMFGAAQRIVAAHADPRPKVSPLADKPD